MARRELGNAGQRVSVHVTVTATSSAGGAVTEGEVTLLGEVIPAEDEDKARRYVGQGGELIMHEAGMVLMVDSDLKHK